MAYEDGLINGDKDLLDLLQAADPGDVGVLVSSLTDSGKGRLAMASGVRQTLEDAKRLNFFSRDEVLLLVRELQHFGGNSVVNVVRRRGVPYAEIVCDVLSYIGGGDADNEAVEELELRVLERLVVKAWEKKSESERAEFAEQLSSANVSPDLAGIKAALRSGGMRAAQAALLAVGSANLLLADGALSLATSIMAKRSSSSILGAVLVTASVQALAKEAYRVTVPCVAQIAYIRQKHLATAAH